MKIKKKKMFKSKHLVFAHFSTKTGDFLQISAIAEEGVALSQYLAISDLLTNFRKGGIASKFLEGSAFVVWS